MGFTRTQATTCGRDEGSEAIAGRFVASPPANQDLPYEGVEAPAISALDEALASRIAF